MTQDKDRAAFEAQIELPSWHEAERNCLRNNETPLDRFIFDNEPAELDSEWRDQLTAVIADAIAHDRQQHERRVDADRAAAQALAELTALIPIKDTLAASASCADLVAYFKRLVDDRQQRGELIGEAGTMPGTLGLTMACFPADKVPVGTKLYTAPQPAEPTRIEFPAHLRKMWSGGEVQAWLDEHTGYKPQEITAKGSLERYRKWQAQQPAEPVKGPSDEQMTFGDWWAREQRDANSRGPGDDWLDLSESDKHQYQSCWDDAYEAAKAHYQGAQPECGCCGQSGKCDPDCDAASAEPVATDWVPCPVCGEPDMRRTVDAEGNALIHCVNHACRSNAAPVAAQPSVPLSMGLRSVAAELLACFRAWGPEVRVLGNVQAKDGADLMQAILATPPVAGQDRRD